MFVRLKVWILLVALAASAGLLAEGQGASAPLKKDDVKKIMQQIFTQHVDQKQMSSAIIRKSLKEYIDQFDPDRTFSSC